MMQNPDECLAGGENIPCSIAGKVEELAERRTLNFTASHLPVKN
jgi:hypothetical protein